MTLSYMYVTDGLQPVVSYCKKQSLEMTICDFSRSYAQYTSWTSFLAVTNSGQEIVLHIKHP